MMLMSEKPTVFGCGTIRVCRRTRSIALVALSRPKLFNAFNDDVYEDLISIMDLVANDPSLSAIVLTGTGPYFSSGADLKNGTFEANPNGRQTRNLPAGRFMLTLIQFPKILAAAVNGPAVGIACTLLLHCDLVHFSPTATFWAPFTRLALVPELCSSTTFIESHGLSKANELLLLGRRIDAQTALQFNICSRVVMPPSNLPQTNDPFDENSLGSQLCNEIDRKLLSLPLGDKTAEYFVKLVKGARSERLRELCLRELEKLDERFDTGQVGEAAKHLQIGASSRRHDDNLQQHNLAAIASQARSKL